MPGARSKARPWLSTEGRSRYLCRPGEHVARSLSLGNIKQHAPAVEPRRGVTPADPDILGTLAAAAGAGAKPGGSPSSSESMELGAPLVGSKQCSP